MERLMRVADRAGDLLIALDGKWDHGLGPQVSDLVKLGGSGLSICARKGQLRAYDEAEGEPGV